MEIAGWAAAVLILAAYGLLTAGRLKADSRAYHWLNIFGAAGFILNSIQADRPSKSKMNCVRARNN